MRLENKNFRKRGQHGPNKRNGAMEMVERKCIGCSKNFPSASLGSRLCARCKERIERSGYAIGD